MGRKDVAALIWGGGGEQQHPEEQGEGQKCAHLDGIREAHQGRWENMPLCPEHKRKEGDTF